MALEPVYCPERAAKILWRLILTDRAKIEHFDEPSRGFNGDPAKLRNLAKEYEHLKNDPSVLADVANYLAHANPQSTSTDLPF